MIGATPAWLQVVLGVVLTCYGFLLVATSVDRSTHWQWRCAVYGLVIWSTLWAAHPLLSGKTDSWAATSFVALVTYVLMRRGRQIRGILDGEDWWPPNANAPCSVLVYLRPRSVRARSWLGVGHRERAVCGPFAPRDYRPGGGWLWCVTYLHSGRRIWCLPYLSYRGRRLSAALGWAPGGALVCRVGGGYG